MAKSAIAQRSFTSILDTPSSDVERPKPIPAGTYTALIISHHFDKSSRKQTDFVEFTLKFLAAVDDVNEDALAEVLGDRKLQDVTTRATYYLTEASLYRLKEFLDHADAGDDDMSIGQRIAETTNKQITVSMKHTASDDGEMIYANVAKTAPVA